MLTLIMNITIFEVYEAESRENMLDVLLEKEKKKKQTTNLYIVLSIKK